MTTEMVRVTTGIAAPADTLFQVLADPAQHAAIDGTGWVREPLDGERLSAVGQIFRMAMYHDNHPAKSYEMANRVTVFDPPRAIAWQPGQDAGDGTVQFGGWVWRYDLASAGPAETRVELSYDWSAVPQVVREHIQFPPFELDHLHNSLRHLSDLATGRPRR